MRASILAILFIYCISGGSCKNRPVTPRRLLIDSASADNNPYITRDQSPMDMSYYPVDYPQQKMNNQVTRQPVMRLLYSRPHKKGRMIFGTSDAALCKYGREWRLGANEATELDLYTTVMVGGKNLSAGRYVLYCVPYPDHWTIIFNSNLDTWGLHIDSSKDIYKTDIPVEQQSPALEDFTMVFREVRNGADLVMAWDNKKAVLSFTFSSM